MPTYLNPELTIERAGPVLEREFRQRYGDQEYEGLYRTIDLVAQEHSTDQTAQEELEILRRRTVAQVLRDARRAVQESPTD
jgi:hypothetical protein